MYSIYCLAKMRINDCAFWHERVDQSLVIDGRPLASLLGVLLRARGGFTLFLHAPRPRSVIFILFVYRLFARRRVKVILQELNFDFYQYRSPKASPRWAVRRTWLSILMATCDHLICHSTQQVDDLKALHPDRSRDIHFVKLPRGHNVAVAQPVAVEQEGGFLLVPGEVRDFGIMFRICKRLYSAGIPVTIVGRKMAIHHQAQEQLSRNFECPGIDLRYDLPRDQYLDLMARARLVVIPMLECRRANGQLTLLDAYALGKATICLYGANLWDYYDDHSVSTYRAGDDAELYDRIIELWQDDAARRRLKRHAYAHLNQFPTKDEFVRCMFSKCGIAE